MEQQPEQPKNPRRSRGTTLGFYFPGLSAQEANAVRERLNTLAAEWGYVAERGDTKGKGTAGRMLMALARGEIHLTKNPGKEEANAKGQGTPAPG